MRYSNNRSASYKQAMSRTVVCAVPQFSCNGDKGANVNKAESLVRKAAAAGAQVILLQELFEGLYWCQEQKAVKCRNTVPMHELRGSDEGP